MGVIYVRDCEPPQRRRAIMISDQNNAGVVNENVFGEEKISGLRAVGILFLGTDFSVTFRCSKDSCHY